MSCKYCGKQIHLGECLSHSHIEWDGFVEWHNDRTFNAIENKDECNCALKDEWMLSKKKCFCCNPCFHEDQSKCRVNNPKKEKQKDD